MGETAEARSLYEEVIEGKTAQLGGTHTSTLQTEFNLAVLLEIIGDVATLQSLLKWLLPKFATTYGDAHASTEEVRAWLAEFTV